jgi:Macrocin-O-methyltransferase (TylF)
MRLSNVLHLPRRLLNYLRTLTSRFAIPWLAKFAGAPPFRFATTSLWPGTYIAHVPDRYSLNHEAYIRRGGEFDCRYLEGFIRGNELINSGDAPRYFSLTVICDQIRKEGLIGDVAELGVYKGNTAVLLAALARKLGSTAYLFDTYQGFAVEDLTGVDADKGRIFGDTSLEAVRSLVGDQNVRYIKGRFPDSASGVPSDLRFCLAHIDCDLHSPFNAALQYFYPRLVQGAFLIMHDYGGLYWGGVEKAVDEFFSDKPEKLVPIPDKSGTVVIRKL